jgi:YaiO family outer membrane protein
LSERAGTGRHLRTGSALLGTASALLVTLLLGAAVPFQAQGQVEDVDEAFQRARTLAFDGRHDEARSLAMAILEIAPDYHDVRILKGRTYAWDGMYGEARRELRLVLERAPRHGDAHRALIDTELWSGDHAEALAAAWRAERHHPTDESILMGLATAYHSLGREREALDVLDRLEAVNPAHPGVRGLRARVEARVRSYRLTASYTHDRFSRAFDPWNTGYVQLGRSTRRGPVIGRLSFASRFGQRAVQPEIEAYPVIADGWYGFVNLGYASHFLFPDLRIGAELHRRLPRSMEASVGLRHLRFADGPVTIYTGSVTEYRGRWMLAVRPWFIPGSERVSRSLQVQARRYGADAENHLTLRAGFGSSPEVRAFQDVPGDELTLRSRHVGLDGHRSLGRDVFGFAAFEVTRQELGFSPGDFSTRYTVNTGIVYRF